MRIYGKTGFVVATRKHQFAYWWPWVKWVPLSVRGHRHSWGYLRIKPKGGVYR